MPKNYVRSQASTPSLLRVLFWILAIVIYYASAQRSTTRQKPAANKGVCLTDSQTPGLAHAFSQAKTAIIVSQFIPSEAHIINRGLCTGLSEARALLANEEFLQFAVATETGSISAEAATILAMVAKKQINVEPKQLYSNVSVSAKLRNGTTLHSPRIEEMARTLVAINSEHKLFALGQGPDDLAQFTRYMEPSTIYQFVMVQHMMLMQKCNGKTILFDPNFGTIVSNGVTDGLIQVLKNYDSALNFAAFVPHNSQKRALIKMPSDQKFSEAVFFVSLGHGDLYLANLLKKENRISKELVRRINSYILTTPLHHAARNGRTAAVSWLLDQGASLDDVDSKGVTAMLIAASEGQADVVELMLKRDSHPNQAYEARGSALKLASQNGHEQTVAVLLAYGADANHRDIYGVTPLMMAAKNGHVGIVKRLLAQGANPAANATEFNGVTALIQAVELGEYEIVKLLLEANANPAQTTADGTSPLALAEKRGHTQIAKLITQYLRRKSEMAVAAIP